MCNVSKSKLNWTSSADILCDWYVVRYTMSHPTHPVQSRHSQIFQYHQIPFREFRRLNYDGRWHGCIIQRYCGHPHCRQRCLSVDCGECAQWMVMLHANGNRSFYIFCLFCFSIATIDTHFWWIIFLYQTPLSPKSFWVNCVCERNREKKIVASACALSGWPRTVIVVVHCAKSVWLLGVWCPVSCVMRNANEGWGMGYVETGSGFTAFRL